VRTDSLSKTFGTGATAVRAVEGASLEIRRKELVLIMGASGSGKTTLLSMLGGLLRPTSGRIFLEGTETTALQEKALPALRARKIGFIFQAFNLMEALTVEENVLLPATLVPQDRGKAREKVGALLERLGLSHRRRAKPGTLSGGEKQRVAIARALVNDPPLILADEPTGSLDSQRGQEVVMLLHDIARDEGRSVVMVTHDARVEEVADRLLWLEDGRLSDRRLPGREWTRDPVCGMRVDAAAPAARTEYRGRTFAFCSTRCRERFLADPPAYSRI
jgi:putative ABC transport system ATP-binding protein